MLSLSLYSLPDLASLNAIWRRTASRRLTWPSSRLSHVGAVESSKSAMYVLAPELRALRRQRAGKRACAHLITILRSTGPVISTRRSRRPGAERVSATETRIGQPRALRALGDGVEGAVALTRRSGLPGRVIADPLGLRDKVGQGTSVERCLVQRAALEQLATGRLEVAVQRREELEGCAKSARAYLCVCGPSLVRISLCAPSTLAVTWLDVSCVRGRGSAGP